MPDSDDPAPRRTIAIGDIHGCSKALEAIIEAINPTDRDLLVPLGDYIDRGPDSRGVIDLLIALTDRCRVVPLLGNHELMLLRALDDPVEKQFWLECGGAATLSSYGDLQQIPDSHLDFLYRCRRYYQTAEHIFVHANYDPRLSLDEQPDYILFWEHLSRRAPGRHESGKTVIVGHTPQPTGEILDLEHVICIDTFCVGSGWLTALDVETATVWQADKLGKLRDD